MKAKVIIALFVSIFLTAVIAAPALGCKSKTTRIIHTPHPSIVATAEPTEEINPTETPEGTTAPADTPEPTETGAPTATPSDNTPTPTSSPEPSPTPVPTDTAQPTATPTQPPASSPTTVPTPTPTTISTPAPSQTPVPNTVYFQTLGNQKIGHNFTIQVRIYNTNKLAYARYDIRFDSSILSYQTTNSSSAIGDGTGSAYFSLDPGSLGDNGLLRIMVDYGAYEEGISGSGYLCYINFSAISTGTSPLSFVSGHGDLPGKLELVKPDESFIIPVSWSNGSVTVVN